jgi:FtsH-binding integral membrane protein
MQPAAEEEDPLVPAGKRISWQRFLFWVLLSGLPSAFLLTVTNVIAVEVGSFPMVWVLPLAAYLGSFVVVFRKDGKAPGLLVRFWPEIFLAGLLLYLMPAFNYQILLGHLFVLLAVCLLVHGELYRDRPDASGLTRFYLAIAVGGGIGGAAVSLGAPLAFNSLHEYPLILVGLGLVLSWCRRQDFAEFRQSSSRLISITRPAILLCLCGLIAFGSWSLLSNPEKFRLRNYYGVSRVVDTPPAEDTPAGIRTLIHGSTMHGIQFLDGKNRRLPTLYYQPERGLAEIFAALPRPRRIGAVGLGAGTVSAYLDPGDRLTYYEIDADIEKIARSWFTFIGDSAGIISVVIGDGRLSLQKGAGGGEKYDLILVDAFSGDGIPTHLITAEAVRIYLERLSDQGILLFHLSNRYYNLRPVLKAVAASLGLQGSVKTVIGSHQPDHYQITTVYGMLTRDQARLAPFSRYGWIPFSEKDGLMTCRPWTDDYVNILAPLWAKLDPFAAP